MFTSSSRGQMYLNVVEIRLLLWPERKLQTFCKEADLSKNEKQRVKLK